ncbi:outer membrane protein W [Microbulbifer aestuariivivens]|uniref:Outer membrane protein W n=1 Tax=Microbulbifer aestuariivivens TaxID=1908308 RepID=A0ABP9WRF9_9GAMM
MKSAIVGILILTAMLAATTATAEHRAGDFIARIGYGEVNPNDDSGWIRLDGSAVEGTRVYVDSGQSATLTGTWLFADHWGLGIVAALPFKHDLDVAGLPNPAGGPALGKVSLGDIEHLPPTVTLQWFPVCVESWVQPYVGIGVNYTTFFSEDISRTANNYFRDALGATRNASLNLDDSWGLAGELGIDIELGEGSQWLFNAAIWYLDIDTDATISFPTDAGRSRVKVDVDVDPWVYSVGIGYRF